MSQTIHPTDSTPITVGLTFAIERAEQALRQAGIEFTVVEERTPQEDPGQLPTLPAAPPLAA